VVVAKAEAKKIDAANAKATEKAARVKQKADADAVAAFMKDN
jgi:hypothetical protein